MKLNDANTVAASNGVHKDINKKNNPAFKWAFIIIGAVVVVMLAMFFIKTFVISVVTVSGTHHSNHSAGYITAINAAGLFSHIFEHS